MDFCCHFQSNLIFIKNPSLHLWNLVSFCMSWMYVYTSRSQYSPAFIPVFYCESGKGLFLAISQKNWKRVSSSAHYLWEPVRWCLLFSTLCLAPACDCHQGQHRCITSVRWWNQNTFSHVENWLGFASLGLEVIQHWLCKEMPRLTATEHTPRA